MISLCALLFLQGAEARQPIPARIEGYTLSIVAAAGSRKPPRLDPKHRWEHPFVVHALLGVRGDEALRFVVHSQTARTYPTASLAARQLLRMLEYAHAHFQYDNPLAYGRRVDVFLSDGGKPGGEQGVFEGPDESGRLRSFNCIYIYDLDSFREPVEMARELAHEFGHVVIPPIGGFEKPERWANGALGERIFLTYLASHEIVDEDRMGAAAEALRAWVAANVQPLANEVFLRGPSQDLVEGRAISMEPYLGLMLMFYEAFPEAFGRATRLAGGATAKDAHNGILKALEERPLWNVAIPERLRNQAIYLPAPGEWAIEGGKALARKGAWLKVQPLAAVVTLTRRAE
ncbi:MAG: hypothetical protein C4341_02015 [Armatimonadota bacterium]